MGIDNITIGDLKSVSSIINSGQSQDVALHYVGRYCIFRTYSAGVFFGILKARNGKEAIIESCRRIWSWSGAFTLSKVATDGVASAKLSVTEPEKLVTELIEVIPASEKTIKQLREMDAHE